MNFKHYILHDLKSDLHLLWVCYKDLPEFVNHDVVDVFQCQQHHHV